MGKCKTCRGGHKKRHHGKRRHHSRGFINGFSTDMHSIERTAKIVGGVIVGKVGSAVLRDKLSFLSDNRMIAGVGFTGAGLVISTNDEPFIKGVGIGITVTGVGTLAASFVKDTESFAGKALSSIGELPNNGSLNGGDEFPYYGKNSAKLNVLNGYDDDINGYDDDGVNGDDDMNGYDDDGVNGDDDVNGYDDDGVNGDDEW